MTALHTPQQNHLLAALPAADLELFASHLELVPMPLGQMLYEPGTQLRHAYFPTTSIVSLAVVQTAGHAYRLDRHLLQSEFNRAGSFQRLLLRYTQALMTQMAQSAVCNRHHSVEQQLCRWLLLTMDRVPLRELVMTQELVASMLGVRRESVTEAAGNLQNRGYIRYRRGHIAVLDRAGLETRVCECYGVVKKELARLLSDVHGSR
ncbi:MAG: Crp/Fnr family transcriptional regulator [Burkholderiales bacterium]|nr:Crp/Fnr family transcriptional regulator [Burkholderiales bacterium]